MDYKKFVYTQKKEAKEKAKIQRETTAELKEIQLNPVIQDADLKVKIKNIQRLLDEGDKVRVVIKFSGRQLKHTELGKVLLNKILDAIPVAVIEKQPVFTDRNLSMVVTKTKT